jgi:hypothetical protein
LLSHRRRQNGHTPSRVVVVGSNPRPGPMCLDLSASTSK